MATTWNAANDFSSVNNPSGTWSYGWSSTIGGSLNLYPAPAQPYGACPGTTVMAWVRSEPTDGTPNVHRNTTAGVASCGCCTWQPNELSFHPGQSGEYGKLRWTAPANGIYKVEVIFSGRDPDGASTDVHVYRDGSSLFDGAVTGYYGTPIHFQSADLTMSAGNVIDVVVGDGGNGHLNDTVALDFQVCTSPCASTSGSLLVTSSPPEAAITLDGVPTGLVTPKTLTVSAGSHTVTVSGLCAGWTPSTCTTNVPAAGSATCSFTGSSCGPPSSAPGPLLTPIGLLALSLVLAGLGASSIRASNSLRKHT